MGEIITRWVKIGIGFVLLWVGIALYNSIGMAKVAGREMEPTYKQDAFKFCSSKKFMPADLEREDVIFYQYAIPGKTTQEVFAGRIIALPGQRVRIENGEVFVDDKKANATFVDAASKSTETREEIVVPRSCVYVLGDNRRLCADFDSRGIGPVATWAILGKMWH